VEQPAEAIPATNVEAYRGLGRRAWVAERRALCERPVRAMLVVVGHIGPHDSLEVSAPEDQGPVQAFAPHASDPALGVRLGLGGANRRADDPDPRRVYKLDLPSNRQFRERV
jgi:hypothetical protein